MGSLALEEFHPKRMKLKVSALEKWALIVYKIHFCGTCHFLIMQNTFFNSPTSSPCSFKFTVL